jgi:hypothetical protein
MRTILIAFLVFLVNLTSAQDFEGTIKWTMKMDITDPKMKAQLEATQKQLDDPSNKAKVKQMEDQMNNPQMKAQLDANPQLKAQMEAALKMMKGGSANSMMPTGVVIKTKNGNSLTKTEGGMTSATETLYLKDKNETYMINRESKIYSLLPNQTNTNTGQDPAIAFKKTTETQKILNYTCTKTIVTITEKDQTINQVFWTTNEIKNINFSNLSGNKLGKGKEAMFYKEIDGVPLKMEMTTPQVNMTMQVTEIKKETLPATDFQLPAGFKEMKLPGQR